MTGGTLFVSRSRKLFPLWMKKAPALGFRDVHVTGEDKDSLNTVINDLKPRLVMVGSCFYGAATPYMMGQLLKIFPGLNIAAVNIHEFPDGLAPFFIWHGVKSYVNLQEGEDEFYYGLEEIKQGHEYIAPTIKYVVDNCEWPEINDKAEKRQLEVLVFLCNGKTPLDIARLLHVCKRTVDWHIEQLFKVFDVHSREELICMAFYLDLVTKDDLRFFDRKNKALPKWAVAKISVSDCLKQAENNR